MHQMVYSEGERPNSPRTQRFVWTWQETRKKNPLIRKVNRSHHPYNAPFTYANRHMKTTDQVLLFTLRYFLPKHDIITVEQVLCAAILMCCFSCINPSNTELNPICPLLALFGAHHILHVSRIKVNVHMDTVGKVLVPLSAPFHALNAQYTCIVLHMLCSSHPNFFPSSSSHKHPVQ